MNKVLIVGAGAPGGPCASILSRQQDVSEIVLGDIDVGLATRVQEKIKNHHLIGLKDVWHLGYSKDHFDVEFSRRQVRKRTCHY